MARERRPVGLRLARLSGEVHMTTTELTVRTASTLHLPIFAAELLRSHPVLASGLEVAADADEDEEDLEDDDSDDDESDDEDSDDEDEDDDDEDEDQEDEA